LSFASRRRFAMKKLSVRDLELKGRRVLVRVDFNVPLDEKQTVLDDTRIRMTLPTIKHILAAGGSAVLMSHLGRPKGKVVPEMSLEPAAGCLSGLLGESVQLAPDCVGEEVRRMASGLEPGRCLLLENLRFHRAETDNDAQFSSELSGLGEMYVNDAFGTAHRAHASVVGVAEHFEKRAAGFLMERELDYLGKALENPKRPYVVVLGGAKIQDKVPVIENLIEKVGTVVIGGAMALTFLRSQGMSVGKSLVEEGQLEVAKEVFRKAARHEVNFLLPVDFVVAREKAEEAAAEVAAKERIPDEMIGLDIGPISTRIFAQAIKGAKTILWNGPMGVFEYSPFRAGTEALAKAIAEATKDGATSIIGGGDTVAAVKMAGLTDRMSHISTGGGASLEFLAGKELPGVEVLTDA
jgi:phosphoglycerate kinase